MSDAKYILWVAEKNGPLEKTEVIEERHQITSVADMGKIISCAKKSLFLYLGPYELGELYGRSKRALSLSSFMGVTNTYGFSTELFDKAMKQPISLQKLFQTVVPQYDFNVVDTPELAWELLHDNWNSTYRVASFVNRLETSIKSVINDKSIFFVKKKM